MIGHAHNSWAARTVAVAPVLCATALVAALALPTVAGAVSMGAGPSWASIAYEGYGHSLIVRFQSFGHSSWSKEGAAGPNTTYSDPALAETGTSTVLAYQGYDHSLIFRWQAYNTGIWNREDIAGFNTTYSAPSIAETPGATYIAVQGPNNSLDYYWQAYGAQTWGMEVVAGRGTTYSAPSLTEGWADHYLYTNIFAVGPNQTMDDWSRYPGATSNDWTMNTISPEHAAYSAPSAITWDDDLVDPPPCSESYCTPLLATDALGVEAAWETNDHDLVVWEDLNGNVAQVSSPGPAYSAPSIAVALGPIVSDAWGTEVAVEGANHRLDVYDMIFCPPSEPTQAYCPLASTYWTTTLGVSVASCDGGYGAGCNAPPSGAPTDPSGGTAYSQPSLVQANNASSIAVEGPNHSLLFYWQAELPLDASADANPNPWNEESAASDWTTYT